jgi:tripartite-type tricarboxylate transporter receptor subunit TctC
MTRSVLVLALTVIAPAVHAGEPPYPSRPIQFIVPFGTGGGGDTVARLLGHVLGPILSTSVVIENRPGAGATLGTAVAAKAPPDGYTILLGNVGPLAIAKSLYRRLPYDPQKDFAPISQLVTYPNVLVIHPSVPVRSVKDLITLAKQRPGAFEYASSGNGSSTHLAAELFKTMAAIDLVHVPYKTASQAVVDVISGQVSMYFSSVVGALPHVKGGKLRALGVTSKQRSGMMPEVPTVAESGYSDYEAVNWLGVLAPAGVSNHVVNRLHTGIVAAMRQKDVESRLAKQGAQVVVDSPAKFSSYIRAEIRKWSKVVEQSGAHVE